MIVVWVAVAIALAVTALVVAAELFGTIVHFLLILGLLILVAAGIYATWLLVKLGKRIDRMLDKLNQFEQRSRS